jgi:hypothetical protein
MSQRDVILPPVIGRRGHGYNGEKRIMYAMRNANTYMSIADFLLNLCACQCPKSKDAKPHES